MITFIANSISIGNIFPPTGGGSPQRIVTEDSDQIVTEATSQNMIIE